MKQPHKYTQNHVKNKKTQKQRKSTNIRKQYATKHHTIYFKKQQKNTQQNQTMHATYKTKTLNTTHNYTTKNNKLHKNTKNYHTTFNKTHTRTLKQT